MRTIEQQKKLLNIARAYVGYQVTQAIQTSDASKADKEMMTRIVNARYKHDSWAMYCKADTMVRDLLLDIIEKTYYGGISDDTAAQHQ